MPPGRNNNNNHADTSSSSSSAAAPAFVDELETGRRTSKLEEESPIPWYLSTRVLVLAAILLLSGAGAGVAVALLSNNNSNSNSSSAQSNPQVPPPPPVLVTAQPSIPNVIASPAPTPAAFVTASPTISSTSTTTMAPSVATSVVPTTFPTHAVPISTNASFEVVVMGDMPYNQVQKTLLEEQVLNLANSTAVLAVHVGDMMGHAAECSILFLQDVSRILQTLPMPTLVLAGDNDFYDCDDPARAWNNHVDTFVPFEQHWQEDPLWEKIQRNPTRPTHVSVVHEGILLVTIDIWQGSVGAANEEENIAWVTDQVETAFASHAIRGVILLGHAQRERTIRPFFERFAALFYNVDTNLYVREVPVLYIHGDGHVWKIDTTFSEQLNWDLFVDLQVDQGEKAPPIALQIAEGFVDDPNFVPLVPETNQQYVLGRGLFRVDRGTGAY